MVIAKTAEIHSRNRNIVENYLADIDHAIKRDLIDINVVSAAYAKSMAMREEFQRKEAFMLGGTGKRIALIAASFFRQPVQAFKWLFIMFFPDRYVRHQAKNLGVG